MKKEQYDSDITDKRFSEHNTSLYNTYLHVMERQREEGKFFAGHIISGPWMSV